MLLHLFLSWWHLWCMLSVAALFAFVFDNWTQLGLKLRAREVPASSVLSGSLILIKSRFWQLFWIWTLILNIWDYEIIVLRVQSMPWRSNDQLLELASQFLLVRLREVSRPILIYDLSLLRKDLVRLYIGMKGGLVCLVRVRSLHYELPWILDS